MGNPPEIKPAFRPSYDYGVEPEVSPRVPLMDRDMRKAGIAIIQSQARALCDRLGVSDVRDLLDRHLGAALQYVDDDAEYWKHTWFVSQVIQEMQQYLGMK